MYDAGNSSGEPFEYDYVDLLQPRVPYDGSFPHSTPLVNCEVNNPVKPKSLSDC